jgi:tRNA A-37 threonylcarbamoyl transferase component Bud32
MRDEAILDINKLSLYVNNIVKKYNSLNKSNNVDVKKPNKNFFSDSIIKLLSLIISKELLFDKEYWNKYGIRFDESKNMQKKIKSIEKTKIKGKGAYGSVYKVKSTIFDDLSKKNKKKFNSDYVAVKIEKLNPKYFIINNLVNGINISKSAAKIKIAPKLYDTFVIIDNEKNVKIIKIFEYIEGDTLNNKKWNSDIEKKNIFSELKKIVHKMNKAGIIHHDLHKGNVMITKTNKIYIIDFDFSGFAENEEQIRVKYMNNNYNNYIVNNDLLNYVYNNCIKDGIIVLP